MFFKQHRSAERDAFSVPHSVQKSIPIKRIYQDGVFQVSGKFSKTWRFFDVNYAVASPEKQRELFMTYCSFLNSLPIGATAKITLFNRQLNQKDFGRTLLMPMQGDRRDLYRNEYNALVLGKAAESNNLIQEKYITVSAEKKSVEEARAFFSRVGTDLTTGLSRMSSSVREITVNDRLRLLHDFYRPGEEQLFRFNLEDTMRRGHDFRDCIAPDCISFQKNHYELGDHVGRTLFLREYASFISDEMITELMDYSSIGCSTMPQADNTSLGMVAGPRCSTTIALIFRGQTHSPVTWCSTRIIPMWASLAAGTQTENCSSSTAPADITMWSLLARRALHLSVDRGTTQNKKDLPFLCRSGMVQYPSCVMGGKS